VVVGDLVFKPRRVPHAFWNAGDQPARLLELISPAGFEHYFRELAPLLATPERDQAAIGEIVTCYNLDIDFSTTPPWPSGTTCAWGNPAGPGVRNRADTGRCTMATEKQVKAAKRNVQKARAGAQKKRSIANMPAKTRTALGKQGAAVAQRKRTGGSSPKTRQELYEEAKRRNLPGRSKMGRDELARALGRR
jgi:hypothetical protein